MSEHRIRLRGGWECCTCAVPEAPPKRLNLPIRWRAEHPKRVRLTRRFGSPPFDPFHQRLVLELEQVAGIDSLSLNGQPIAEISPERTRYEIPLDGAPERNTLVMELETSAAGRGAAPEWGLIALVIRPI